MRVRVRVRVRVMVAAAARARRTPPAFPSLPTPSAPPCTHIQVGDAEETVYLKKSEIARMSRLPCCFLLDAHGQGVNVRLAFSVTGVRALQSRNNNGTTSLSCLAKALKGAKIEGVIAHQTRKPSLRLIVPNFPR